MSKQSGRGTSSSNEPLVGSGQSDRLDQSDPSSKFIVRVFPRAEPDLAMLARAVIDLALSELDESSTKPAAAAETPRTGNHVDNGNAWKDAA